MSPWNLLYKQLQRQIIEHNKTSCRGPMVQSQSRYFAGCCILCGFAMYGGRISWDLKHRHYYLMYLRVGQNWIIRPEPSRLLCWESLIFGGSSVLLFFAQGWIKLHASGRTVSYSMVQPEHGSSLLFQKRQLKIKHGYRERWII